MTITKILEATLNAGTSTVIFTDNDIPNSLLRVYCTDDDLYPVSQVLSGNTVTITYEVQSVNKYVALEIVKDGLQVIDNLTTNDDENALSAKQGKVLKDTIDSLTAPSLTELSDVDFISLTDGDIIVYDGINEEFKNQSMPSIPTDINDLDDVNVTSIQDGQVLAWDNVSQKFVNVTPQQSSDIQYTTNEVKIGSFLNVDLFRKTFDLGSDVSVSYNGWTTLTAVISDIYLIINCWGTNVGGTFTPLQGTYTASKQIQVQTPRNGYNQNVRFLTIEYTKEGIT